MFSKELFAERLLALRKTKNLSQSQLAEQLGVSFHQVSKMEKAQRAASVEVLYALAAFFDVSADYMLGLSDVQERR